MATPALTSAITLAERVSELVRIPRVHCHIYAGRRMAPGEDPDAVFAHLSQIVRAS